MLVEWRRRVAGARRQRPRVLARVGRHLRRLARRWRPSRAQRQLLELPGQALHAATGSAVTWCTRWAATICISSH